MSFKDKLVKWSGWAIAILVVVRDVLTKLPS